MAKRLNPALTILALWGGAALALSGCRTPAPTGAPAANVLQAEPLSAPVAGSRAVAEAKVIPALSATLSLPVGGVVGEVLVPEGGMVEAGQVILKLSAGRLAAAAAQAGAALQSAEARYAELKAGARAQEIAAAAAQLAAAQAARQKLQDGPDENQVIAARADLANGEAALKQARAAYDRVSYDPGVGARPEALQLEQATNTYNAAKARLDVLVGGPRPADVAAADAEIRRAQAQLDLLQAGPRAETLAAAEADVAAARATLEQAQAALAETELRAPFAGTVASLAAKVGENVAPGAPVVRLADLSSFELETDDLTELNVVLVREGDPALVTFDALPGLQVPGHVARVRSFGESSRGEVVYTVTIRLDEQDPRLRWNMTASATINPE